MEYIRNGFFILFLCYLSFIVYTYIHIYIIYLSLRSDLPVGKIKEYEQHKKSKCKWDARKGIYGNDMEIVYLNFK